MSTGSADYGSVGRPRAVVDAYALVPAILFLDNLYWAVSRDTIQPVLCSELRDEVIQALEHMLRHQALTEQDRYVYRSLWATCSGRASRAIRTP